MLACVPPSAELNASLSGAVCRNRENDSIYHSASEQTDSCQLERLCPTLGSSQVLATLYMHI